jgi:hypothetical protein
MAEADDSPYARRPVKLPFAAEQAVSYQPSAVSQEDVDKG